MKKFLIILIFVPSNLFATSNLEKLTQSIKSVCPIDGITMRGRNVTQIEVSYGQTATNSDRKEAEKIINSFDWSQPETKEKDAFELIDELRNEIANLQSDIAILKKNPQPSIKLKK